MTTQTGHWARSIDVEELHEPTVRAIINTMRRTGATFAAHVLECQYRHDQIEDQENLRVRQLRDLADFLEANPDLDIVILSGTSAWNRACIRAEDAAAMATLRRRIGGKWDKESDGIHFNLNGKIGEAFVQIYADRDQVCERVVTGTETRLVPDLEAAPMIEQEVEIVEWVCPDAILQGADAHE